MKRLLVASADRHLTTDIAEALDDDTGPWDVARAHSALEAFLLLDRGERPFDAVLVDVPLPDQDARSLLDQIRRTEVGRHVLVLLLGEPDDPMLRHMLTTPPAATRFIEKPTSVDVLRAHLGRLKSPRWVLLAEGDEALRARYARILREAGYRVEALSSGRTTIARQPRLRPAAVVSNLQLPDLNGLAACSLIRQAAVTPHPKILLYGALTALKAQRGRAAHAEPDDFVPSPFDDEVLVDRLAALIGHDGPVPRRRSPVDRARAASAVPRAERRRHPRTRSAVQVLVLDDHRQFQTESVDLSPDGMFLRTDESVAVGAVVELIIDLVDRHGLVRTDAQVTWITYTSPRPGFGVRFLNIDPAANARLEAYLAKARRVR